jgi:hypothetical protein
MQPAIVLSASPREVKVPRPPRRDADARRRGHRHGQGLGRREARRPAGDWYAAPRSGSSFDRERQGRLGRSVDCRKPEAALVSTWIPTTERSRACTAGGFDATRDQPNHVTQASRQPGSCGTSPSPSARRRSKGYAPGRRRRRCRRYYRDASVTRQRRLEARGTTTATSTGRCAPRWHWPSRKNTG